MKISENSESPLYDVFVENLQDKLTVNNSIEGLIRKTVFESLKLSEMKYGCEVSITLVDDARIREINQEFRNINAATDVLSFPMVEMEEGVIISVEGDIDKDENLLVLGDIVISMERASQQAEDYGHSLDRELAFLISHGVFHLLGYDHMDSEQEKRMLGKQEEVLSIMGLARE